jgi:voltage-gated potassium channel
MKPSSRASVKPGAKRRWRALVRLERWLEPVMIGLGLAWLLLLIFEFTWGERPWLQPVSTGIWTIFILEFALRLTIAPRRAVFLKRNWLTIIALALPALRILRFARALRLFRATRGLRLVRLITSMNRGLQSIGRAMQRRGAGYVGLLTVMVTFAGAAGMLAFEGRGAERGFDGYAEALWWTAMLVTTVGSDYWPVTVEGRILSLLLSIYAVGVFGYLAASLASIFIERDATVRSAGDAQASGARSNAKTEALKTPG